MDCEIVMYINKFPWAQGVVINASPGTQSKAACIAGHKPAFRSTPVCAARLRLNLCRIESYGTTRAEHTNESERGGCAFNSRAGRRRVRSTMPSDSHSAQKSKCSGGNLSRRGRAGGERRWAAKAADYSQHRVCTV